VHGASTGQGEGTNVEANNISGGGPVRHKIPLGISIFIVVTDIKVNIFSNNKKVA